MVFIGEKKELSRNTAEACCREGAFCLGIFNAEVLLTVNAEDGSVPTIYIEVRRSLKHLRTLAIRILIPRCLPHIPVGEPHFFGFNILLLCIEDTIVCNECLETLVVITCQPIYTITAETCTNGSESLCINPGFLAKVVDCRKVILHTLT